MAGFWRTPLKAQQQDKIKEMQITHFCPLIKFEQQVQTASVCHRSMQRKNKGLNLNLQPLSVIETRFSANEILLVTKTKWKN